MSKKLKYVGKDGETVDGQKFSSGEPVIVDDARAKKLLDEKQDGKPAFVEDSSTSANETTKSAASGNSPNPPEDAQASPGHANKVHDLAAPNMPKDAPVQKDAVSGDAATEDNATAGAKIGNKRGQVPIGDSTVMVDASEIHDAVDASGRTVDRSLSAVHQASLDSAREAGMAHPHPGGNMYAPDMRPGHQRAPNEGVVPILAPTETPSSVRRKPDSKDTVDTE
jgi:hypothetical protein